MYSRVGLYMAMYNCVGLCKAMYNCVGLCIGIQLFQKKVAPVIHNA